MREIHCHRHYGHYPHGRRGARFLRKQFQHVANFFEPYEKGILCQETLQMRLIHYAREFKISFDEGFISTEFKNTVQWTTRISDDNRGGIRFIVTAVVVVNREEIQSATKEILDNKCVRENLETGKLAGINMLYIPYNVGKVLANGARDNDWMDTGVHNRLRHVS